MQTSVHASKAMAIEALAEHLAACITERVQANGQCSLALAGGSTPKALYERLAQPDFAARIPWTKLSFYWGDERCVSSDDANSNYRMASDSLLTRVPVDPMKVHRVQGELDPASAAASYSEELKDVDLDIVLLGMGGDGHTASLFPDGPELGADQDAVSSLSPIAPKDRITLTLACIQRARHVFFLVTGPDKAQRIQEVGAQLRLPISSMTLPAARVRPCSAPAIWFGDRDALGNA